MSAFLPGARQIVPLPRPLPAWLLFFAACLLFASACAAWVTAWESGHPVAVIAGVVLVALCLMTLDMAVTVESVVFERGELFVVAERVVWPRIRYRGQVREVAAVEQRETHDTYMQVGFVLRDGRWIFLAIAEPGEADELAELLRRRMEEQGGEVSA